MFDRKNHKDLALLEVVVGDYTVDNRVDWKSVVLEMTEHFPEDKHTKEKWRSMYRWCFNEKFQVQRSKAIKKRDDKREGRFDLKDRVRVEIKRARSMRFLMERLGATRIEILAAVQELMLEGIVVSSYQEDGEEWFKYAVEAPTDGNEYEHYNTDTSFTIGLVSDSHLGSNWEQLDALHHFYDKCVERGVTDVYNSGDITEGFYKNRPGVLESIHKYGFQQQLDYAIDVYPSRKGLVTHFITGKLDCLNTIFPVITGVFA